MYKRLLSMLTRLANLFGRDRSESGAPNVLSAPLDYVERLQQHGTTLPVLMEFGRGGW